VVKYGATVIEQSSITPCNKVLEQDNVHLGGTNTFIEQES